MGLPMGQVGHSFKRIRRHLVLAGLSGFLFLSIFFSLESSHTMYRWSMSSAYAGLAFLAVSLLIGPWNVVRGVSNPVHTDLRRDIGIWGGVWGLIHTVVGLQVHMSGHMWRYFVFPSEDASTIPIRYDLFGIANYTGLCITMILVLLLGLSNDSSLARLGRHRWKALQRFNYGAFILVILHGTIYQFLEKRVFGFVVGFAVIVLAVSAFQWSGFRQVSRGRTPSSRSAPVSPQTQ